MRSRPISLVVSLVALGGCEVTIGSDTALPGENTAPLVDPSCQTCAGECAVVARGLDDIRYLSSDGESLYLMNGTPHGFDVIRLAADGTLTTLTTLAGWPLDFTVGPSALAWTDSPSSGAATAFVMPKSGGTPHAVASVMEYHHVLVDDAFLYGVDPGGQSLVAVMLGGGAPATIAPLGAHEDPRLAFVDDRAVYFDDRDGGWRQPKDGSPATQLGGQASSTFAGGSFFVLSPPELDAVPSDASVQRVLVTWQSPGVFYGAPGAITTDGSVVTFIDPVCPGHPPNQGCPLRSVPTGGGAATTLCTSIEIPLFVATLGDATYFVDGDKIVRLVASR